MNIIPDHTVNRLDSWDHRKAQKIRKERNKNEKKTGNGKLNIECSISLRYNSESLEKGT